MKHVLDIIGNTTIRCLFVIFLFFYRRKKEDNMAVIFMGFILVTLICNFPRLVMNIHELWTIR